MQQNKGVFQLVYEGPDGTVIRANYINEIQAIELAVALFKNEEFRFKLGRYLDGINRASSLYNNVMKFRGMPMHRKIALKKAHKIAKQMQQDKNTAVNSVIEPSATIN